VKILLAVAAAITALVLANFLFWRRKAVPDQIEAFGPFELVTHTIRYRTGWNTGQPGTGTIDEYSLRYKGKPLTFVGKSGMFGDDTATYERMHRIIVASTEPPAFAVNVGDPNNSSFFYLVREVDGAVKPEYLTLARAGPSAGFVDAAADDTSTTEEQARRRIKGGEPRFLLLAQDLVLDLDSLKSYPIKELDDFHANHFRTVLATAPDRHSFARFGFTNTPESKPAFAVFDFIDGTSYLVPIDRARMRYNEWAEIDSAWTYHHFEWTRVDGQHDRLVERAGFVPLPHRGRRSTQGSDSTYREYNVMHVQREMFDTLGAFLERQLGATRTELKEYDDHRSATYQVGDRVVHTLGREDEVGLWMDRGADTAFVWEIGDRFDRVLATGVHDALFLP
jgi:hypothetical protein